MPRCPVYAAGFAVYIALGSSMKIPSVPLVPTPETAEAKEAVGFKWAGEPIGKRHRIGGEPDWIQDDYVPICSCQKPMSFYGQLDSLGDSHNIGDCGMIFVFLCWDCFETKSVLQCY